MPFRNVLLYSRFQRKVRLITVGILYIILVLSACSTMEADFEAAKQINTVEGYSQFLADHKKSPYEEEAKILRESVREKVWFEKAKYQDTLPEFEAFLLEYPTGKYSSMARELHERLMYKQAVEKNSRELLQNYLLQYPKGAYTAQIEAILEIVLFEQVSHENSARQFDLFLARFPKSKYLAEVSRLREEALFADARIRKSLTAYYRYLTEYPRGLHVMEAREFISDRKELESLELEVPDIEKAWDLTLELDSYFQYEWFIKQFPESRYSQKAKELLSKRKEAIGFLKN